ncbi:MAG: hypothetical protein ACRDXX_02755 [Stackebrandtia sp.]
MLDAFARAVLPLALFIVAGSLLMLLATKDGTAERAITIFALIAGLLAAGTSVLLLRFGRREG